MLQIRILMFALCVSCSAFGQLPVTEPDKSPMDMSYAPQGYPVLKFQSNSAAKPNARVIYSRPQVKGRDIFGGEVKYNELWRMGANETTELQLFKNAMIGGKKVLKGRYSLYCIPTADTWTIIINSDTDSWGAFSYRQDLDVVRVSVPVQKNETPTEYLTMYFDPANNLVVMWSGAKASLPIQFLAK